MAGQGGAALGQAFGFFGFVALQAELAEFMALAGALGGFFVAVAGPQLAFGKAVIVHQGNLAGADIAARAAFDAVKQMGVARLVKLARLGEPVQVHRLQFGRAHLGAVAAADARHGRRARRKQRRAGGNQAVAGLGEAGAGVGQGKAHHRPAHDDLVAVRLAAGFGQQPVGRRAQQRFDIARARHCAGQRHQPLDGWFAMLQRAGGGVERGHVQALHAKFGRAPPGRHRLAGQQVDQLLGAAAGVEGGDDHHVKPAAGAGGAHGGNRLWFIVFNANQHLARLGQLGGQGDAGDDAAGAFAHQPVVAGDIGLALGAVDHQGVQPASGQLEVGGEQRAAQAGHAARLQGVQHLRRVGVAPVQRGEFDPAFVAVRLQLDAGAVQPGGVSQRQRADGAHHARGGRVHRHRHGAVGVGQALALEHALANADAGPRGRAHALRQRQAQQRRQAGGADWRFAGLLFVFGRMHAAMKRRQRGGHGCGSCGAAAIITTG